MANYLKVKTVIASVAITLVIVYELVEISFFKPVVNKRWEQLTWKDFSGVAPPFSKYYAGISSSVKLEYDSSRSGYLAYAVQHNVRSWVRDSGENSWWELDHEQYHFNITEIFARRLNQYIKENPDGTQGLFDLRNGSLKFDRDEMQQEYDSDTDHGLRIDRQQRWKYKIDSMLVLEDGWRTDYMSGARVYFPTEPNNSDTAMNGVAYRRRFINKYGMSFWHSTTQNLMRQQIIANALEQQEKRRNQHATFYMDTLSDIRGSLAYDSAGHHHKMVWEQDGINLHTLYVKYPLGNVSSTGYQEISASFLNSFSIVTTDEYWKSNFKQGNVKTTNVTKVESYNENRVGTGFTVSAPKVIGFIREPIYNVEGTMMLIVDFSADPEAEHYREVLLYGGHVYLFESQMGAQQFWLPAEKVPKTEFEVSVGYILKKDSAENFKKVFRQVVRVQSKRE